jgi:hypothetical protein
MIYKELNYESDKVNVDSIFRSIHNSAFDVCVIRNFLNRDEVERIVEIYNQNVQHNYEVYDGYKALPRPFDHIPRTPAAQYNQEIATYLQAMESSGVKESFITKLKNLSPDYTIHLNTNDAFAKSGTWSSLRELELGKGYFEVHCGRLFQEWNEDFYDFFSQKADIDNQLAFLVVLQRPETNCDIEIFDLKWTEADVKIDTNTLKLKTGEVLTLDKIPSKKVILNEGDMLIFDEGNYWHLVPPFGGEKPRLSFGAFITKLIDKDEVVLWC